MTRRIIVLPSATDDLEDQADYLAARSWEASVRFGAAVHDACRMLAVMPGIGSPQDFGRPDLAGLRCFRVPKFENHLIFYRATEEVVEVFRIAHGARDLPALFEDDGEPDA